MGKKQSSAATSNSTKKVLVAVVVVIVLMILIVGLYPRSREALFGEAVKAKAMKGGKSATQSAQQQQLTGCQGGTPQYSQLCSGDDTGFSGALPKKVVTSCTATKCEYTCNAVDGIQYVPDFGLNTCVRPYQCTNIPTNAQLCSGDNQGLTTDTSSSVVDSCSVGKCGFICNVGYKRSGNSCVPNECTGERPANSYICYGDDQGLTSNTPYIVLESYGCTSGNKCEVVCIGKIGDNLGGGKWDTRSYEKSGNSCVKAKCPGVTPLNTELCPGDNQPNNDDVGWIISAGRSKEIVEQCSSSNEHGSRGADTWCEYTCKPGYTRMPGTTMGSPYDDFCLPNTSPQCYSKAFDLITGLKHIGEYFTPTPGYASPCPGDEQGLTSHTLITLTNSCTTSKKCEYVCDNGYVLVQSGSENICTPATMS